MVSSKKQSLWPSDVINTSTTIALAGANGTSGSMYTKFSTFGWIGLN